jgi:hypothetical protein
VTLTGVGLEKTGAIVFGGTVIELGRGVVEPWRVVPTAYGFETGRGGSRIADGVTCGLDFAARIASA